MVSFSRDGFTNSQFGVVFFFINHKSNFSFDEKYSFWYSIMNMRQLHILFNSAKTLLVIVCLFMCFSQIYLSWTKNCFEHQNRTILGLAQVNSGEKTDINKQSLVKFWMNWIEYGAVSYSFHCTVAILGNDTIGNPTFQKVLQN